MRTRESKDLGGGGHRFGVPLLVHALPFTHEHSFSYMEDLGGARDGVIDAAPPPYEVR